MFIATTLFTAVAKRQEIESKNASTDSNKTDVILPDEVVGEWTCIWYLYGTRLFNVDFMYIE